MDPDVCLKEQLKISSDIIQLIDAAPEYEDFLTKAKRLYEIEDLANALAERVQCLAGWLEKGGFLPKAWRNPQYVAEKEEECDECGSTIPIAHGGSLANKYHDSSCSLHDPEAA